MDKPYTERTGGSYVRDKSGKAKLVDRTLAEAAVESPKAAPPAPVTEPKKDK